MSRPLPELLRLARSRDWADRATAGHELAPLVDDGDAQVRAALTALLLDPDDTAVTDRTATALLTHGGRTAWWLFLHAWSRAGPERLDHLADAFREQRWRRAAAGDTAGEEALRAQVEAFVADEDAGVRAAAAELAGRFGPAAGTGSPPP
ncbi:hypothetical protein [Cellulomonas sp. NS3]|uniref:hypothetical protein n=1 Tax=Cellulomonas sp. NS3 TaxID=2973977 RepID=UPI002161758E|nr:hypothetical protein [Cellulomonas sp. NS3]